MRFVIALVAVVLAALPVAAQQVEVGASTQSPGIPSPSQADLRELGTFVNPPILDPEATAPEEEAAETEPAGFRLDLSSLPTLPPNEFTLFHDPLYSREAQLGFYGDYPSAGRPGSYPSAVIALPTAFRWDTGEGGGLDMTLFSLKPKEWNELDTWEKIGWVTARASAIAGAAIILDSLF